jgi:hypothetical protein
LKQTTAQASSTNANHRPESRSHRTCRRRQLLSQDNARSIFQRWRPSRVEDSIPRRAIRGLIPRRRRYARFTPLSYALSAWILPGRVRRRPDGVRIGGTSSRTAWNMLVSLTLAAVTAAVSGSPPPSQTRWSLLPGLPRSTGFAPTWSPHAWPARSWCPHWPATSPAGPARPTGPAPPDAAGRTRRPSSTPLGGASRSLANRSRARGRAAVARGGGTGHEHDRGEAVAIRDGPAPAAVRRPRRGRQQGLHERPQLVRHQVINKTVMARDLAIPAPRSETPSY